MSYANESAYPIMENNKYKSKCPSRLSFNYNGFHPYGREQPQPSPATQDAVSVLSKMNYRVNDGGFYLPTPLASTGPSFTFHQPVPINSSQNVKLPPASPLTPSCAYYKSPAPKFVYPEDLLPPTSLFSKSIAGSLMAEELGEDRITKPRSHDIASILSLPQDNWDTESYDLFDSVCTTEPQICSYNDFHTTEFIYRSADDITATNHQVESRPSLFDPEYFTKQHISIPSQAKGVKKEDSASKFIAKTKTSKSVRQKTAYKEELKCECCSKSFSHRSALNVHIRIHTGVRPYTCQVCGRSFSDNSTYVKHLRIHTKEKPYSCDICHKSFSQSGNLTRHKKVHKS